MELARKTVKEMLDGLLDEEADDLVGAERCERTADREAYRAGHYERKPTAIADEATIRMPVPMLKGLRFAAAISERYLRRETSVEETMIGICLAGVPTRRLEDVNETLWGQGCPPQPSSISTGWHSRRPRQAQPPARARMPLCLLRRDVPREVPRT